MTDSFEFITGEQQISAWVLELTEQIYNRMLKEKNWDHPDLVEFRTKAHESGIRIEKKSPVFYVPGVDFLDRT